MTDTDNPTLRIRGPIDLLTAVPHLLGFHPQESLVLVGMTHGVLVVTARVDLADTADQALVGHTIAAMIRGGSTAFVAAVFTDTPSNDETLPYAALADDLARGVRDAGAQLVDCLLVHDGLWWSYQCENPQCCPRDGRPLPEAPTPFQAAATVAGLTVAASRDELAARFTPQPGRERLRPLIDTAADAMTPMTVDGKLALHGRVARRAILNALQDARGGYRRLDDVDVARAGAALRHLAIRDAVWLAVEKHPGGDELWLNLARRLPSPYDAAPLFLYGWSTWRQGNGALAAMAAARALASEPSYSAARLLTAVLRHALDPRRMLRLHAVEDDASGGNADTGDDPGAA